MVNFTAADRVGSIGGYIGGIATLASAMGGCNGGLLGNLFGGNCHPVQLCSENKLPTCKNHFLKTRL